MAVQMSSAAQPRTRCLRAHSPWVCRAGVPRANWETSRALNPLSSCQEGENVPSARTLLDVCLTAASDVVWVLARPTPVFSPRVPPCHPWK